jgi:hypothetical protein
MSYQHMFYGLDLGRLQSIYGSGDEAFVAEVLQAKGGDLADNDEFFRDYVDDFPTSETALREIVAGSIPKRDGTDALYGYVLRILCEHLGQSIGEDVAKVSEHPYKSRLVANGPPVPIPINPADFPEIGHLPLSEIPNEIKLLDATPRRARRSIKLAILRRLTGGIIGRQMSDDDLAEDMDAYRATLEEAQHKGVSIVSFRH